MNFKVIALTIGTLFLAACAAPQISLSTQTQTSIDQIEGVLVIRQTGLDVTVQNTNPGNTGLLGALIVAAIDSSRRSSAEEKATPILEELKDYDFRSVMLNEASEALRKTENNKIAIPLRSDNVGTEPSLRIAFDKSAASALLVWEVKYRMESGNLLVDATVVMYPKAPALKQYRAKPDEANPLAEGNAIYRKSFSYTQQAVSANTVKDGLTTAAKNLARQLAADVVHGRS